MKIALEYDDWGPSHPLAKTAFRWFEDMKEHFPSFKVTLFTVPMEIRYTGGIEYLTKDNHKVWVDICKKAYDQGWMRFALHGLTHLGPTMSAQHVQPEFQDISYDEAKKRIIVGERCFKEAGLPLEKIFKAPNWALSQEGARAAIDLNYRIVKDRYYDWNLKDDPPSEKEAGDKIIIAHGHVQDGDGCDNGIAETMHRIMALPAGTEFYHLSEAL